MKKNVVLIHQMGKVASTTVAETIKLNSDYNVMHTHNLEIKHVLKKLDTTNGKRDNLNQNKYSTCDYIGFLNLARRINNIIKWKKYQKRDTK